MKEYLYIKASYGVLEVSTVDSETKEQHTFCFSAEQFEKMAMEEREKQC
jgi:hypothetical protein